MKNFFKNKKLWAILIPVVCVAVAAAIAVPHFINDSVDPKSTTENEAAVNVDNKAEKKPETVENNTVDDSLEAVKPVEKESIVKISGNTITLDTISFEYNSFEEKDSLYGDRPTKEFKTNDLDWITIDAETEVIYNLMLNNGKTIVANPTSTDEAEVEAVARKIASKLCEDMDRYNECDVFKDVNGCYSVAFVRKIAGYRTAESVCVFFDENAKFISYMRKPNIFDGIDISDIKVDEKAILAAIDSEAKNLHGEAFGYNELKSIIIKVNDGKVIAQATYRIHRKDEIKESNALYTYEQILK